MRRDLRHWETPSHEMDAHRGMARANRQELRAGTLRSQACPAGLFAAETTRVPSSAPDAPPADGVDLPGFGSGAGEEEGRRRRTPGGARTCPGASSGDPRIPVVSMRVVGHAPLASPCEHRRAAAPHATPATCPCLACCESPTTRVLLPPSQNRHATAERAGVGGCRTCVKGARITRSPATSAGLMDLGHRARRRA